MATDSERSAPAAVISSRTVLNAAALLAGTLLLHNPIAVFTSSERNFEYGIVQISVVLAAVFAAAVLALLLPTLFLPRWARRGYVTLLTAVAACTWIYSNLLQPRLGLLDGNRLDLTLTTGQEVLHWSMLFFLLAAFSLLCHRYLAQMSVFILVLNCGLVAVSVAPLFRAEKGWASLEATADDENMYRFSAGQKNLLIVLMDHLQADVLFEALHEGTEPPANRFGGFTFYKNALGVAPTTYLSFPAMHAGRGHQIGEKIMDFVRFGVRTSFLRQLDAAGVDVAFANPMMSGGCPGNTCVSSAIVERGPRTQLVSEAAFLVDISFFRAAPMPLKRHVYREERWLLSPLLSSEADMSHSIRDNRFMAAFAEKVYRSGDVSTLKFVYLSNTHKPTDINAECRFEALNFSRVNYKTQIHCALKPLIATFERLDAIGAYDDTAILLTSDHGVTCCLPTQFAGTVTKETRDWASLAGSASPAFLFKPFAKRGAMEISMAPVQLTDVGATACDVLDSCERPYGRSILDIGEDEERERHFLWYKWRTKYWQRNTLPLMTRYTVNGPLYEEASWEKISTGR